MSKISQERIWTIVGVVVAIVAIVVSLTTPEIRRWMGLEPPVRDTATVLPAPLPQEQAKKSQPAPAAGSNKQPAVLYAYRGIVVDSLERPVSGVRVLCSTCEYPQTTTDEQGNFLLEKRFTEEDEFRQEAVTFSKPPRSITLYLNWREIVPIKF